MTSPATEITVECPECWTRYYDWYRPSINATLDSALVADADYMASATSATCPRCEYRVELSVLTVDGGTWRQTSGLNPHRRDELLADLVVVCIDVGSVKEGRFGWAATPVARDLEDDDYRDPRKLVETVARELQRGRPVALGFECPLVVPVPTDPHVLGAARSGEGNRAWSAGAGAGSLATGLVQIAWVLRELRERCPSDQLHQDLISLRSAASGLFIWEALVTAGAKAKVTNPRDAHTADAEIAVRAFRRAVIDPFFQTDIQADHPLSLAAAAAIWSGWLDSQEDSLSSHVLVVKATETDIPPNWAQR